MKIISSRMFGDPLWRQGNDAHPIRDGLAALGCLGIIVDPVLNGAPVRPGERHIICPQPTMRNADLQAWLRRHPQADVALKPGLGQQDIVEQIGKGKTGVSVLLLSADKTQKMLGEEEPDRAAEKLSALMPQALAVVTGRKYAAACQGGHTTIAPAFQVPDDQIQNRDGLGGAFLAAFLQTMWITGKVSLALVHGHANAAGCLIGAGPQSWGGLENIVRSFHQY